MNFLFHKTQAHLPQLLPLVVLQTKAQLVVLFSHFIFGVILDLYVDCHFFLSFCQGMFIRRLSFVNVELKVQTQ